MSTYINRTRDDKKKSIVNKQRFLKRVRKNLKKSLPKVVNNNTIKDLTSKGGKVKIPIKGIKEPSFGYGKGSGQDDYVLPGNKTYQKGDKIKKPQGGKGQGGRQGSKDGDIGEDEFVVTVSKEEFMDLFFEDLKLPDMIKQYLEKVVDWKRKRAGYTTTGNPSSLNLTESYKKSLSRRMSMRGAYKRSIDQLEEELKSEKDPVRIEYLKSEIERITKLMNIVPFMDDMDLKYNNFENEPVPTTQAVVFCVMDVSGSMGEHHKDLAKRFFMLLYMFLEKEYESIEIVYIRHHTEAKEVDEQEFFDSRETGGTQVYPALQLANDIYEERYGSRWNSYLCQISDGDVWGMEDAQKCQEMLENTILPKFQYGWYLEVGYDDRQGDLFEFYENVVNDNFRVSRITSVDQIWETFRGIFSTEK